MSVLTGNELTRSVEEFARRGACFYHACQLKDLRTYFWLGGIPSRERMEESGQAYTPFQTDAKDRQNGVWSKVFGNLTDFGFGFSLGSWTRDTTAPVPNPYGPILLISRPEILLEADGVAICLRSAGGSEFQRENESLRTSADVARLFRHPFEPGAGPRNSYVKYSDELRQEFADRVPPVTAPGWRTLNPEVSCTTSSGSLSLQHLDCVLVDEYDICDRRLFDVVAAEMKASKTYRSVSARNYLGGQERRAILRDIAKLCRSGPIDLNQFLADATLTPQSRDWATRIQKGSLDWLFKRYVEYLYVGMLSAV